MSLKETAVTQRLSRSAGWRAGVLAGLAGGSAEIAWITLYANLSDGNAAAIARGVTRSVHLDVAPVLTAPVGVAIHMALAMALGAAIAILLRPLTKRIANAWLQASAIVASLVVVWAVNFFLVLPAINPSFVEMVPYGTSLVSKLLFGIATAFVLQVCNKPSPVVERA